MPLGHHATNIHLLLLSGHSQLLALALRQHLVELVQEDGVRLDALVVVHRLGLAMRWSV